MSKVGRSIMSLTLAAIGLLTVLSVIGAFYGADRAKQLFNSIPLDIYWYCLTVLFVVGLFKFPRLLQKPPLLIIHAGCLLVLIGGMWGSQTGHQIAKRFLGVNKIQSGYMVIYKGQSENRIFSEDFKQCLGQLPFSIKLKNFRLEYYDSDKDIIPQLNIKTDDGQHLQLAAKVGEEVSWNQGKNKLRVVRTFTNLKVRIENGEKTITDEAGTGKNPAVEVEITKADGTSYKRYVFERSEGHYQNEDGIQVSYVPHKPPVIRDYISDVEVVENEKVAANKMIEVNHPLYYGGYHFFQYSYDWENGQYTILLVTSDSGLYIVYSGYWLLCLGVFWRFWLGGMADYIKSKNVKRGQSDGD